MPTPVLKRRGEAGVVEDFLDSASTRPSALVLEGEAGIGKSTLWLAAIEQARERGFVVLSARAAAAESVLTYASLADLLGGLDSAAWAGLPEPQQVALGVVLARAETGGAITARHAVCAGFLAAVEGLAARMPVLLAIDDAQWVDPSSMQVVAFAARRLSGQVGVLATVRTEAGRGGATSWLQLPRPDGIRRVRVSPLSLAGLHSILAERLGRSFTRPTMSRIVEISGGNPFYALELARAMIDARDDAVVVLPGTLGELVRARIGRLDSALQQVLRAAACLGAPTVRLVAAVIDADVDSVVKLLEHAENDGIIVFEGLRVRFTHPLLARGVYTDMSPSERRHMHRRLAEIVEEPELQARHLAMAGMSGDPRTLRLLDSAAKTARARGAPAAAAELVDLAVSLGGDTPSRRIHSAANHFAAGDVERARSMLEAVIDQLGPGLLRAKALSVLGGVRLFDDSFAEAARLLGQAVEEAAGHLALRVMTLITLTFAHYNTGDIGTALLNADHAVLDAERLGHPGLLSQALGMRVMLGVLNGEVDGPKLRRALDLEDPHADTPMAFRPGMQNALQLAWTGQFDDAHGAMLPLRQRCIERGEEHELMFVAFHSVVIEIWRGNFNQAHLVAEDAMERALQLGGDIPMVEALTMRAAVTAYLGREVQTRNDSGAALKASERCSGYTLAQRTMATLGFLEVSLGNYDAALVVLEPLIAKLDTTPIGTAIIPASFVADAVEALIARGRLDDAEPLVERFERDGRRLDRPWLSAIGGRGHSMLQAAHGDTVTAIDTASRAMEEHDRLLMPFERARTQMLLGQLQRRRRRKDAAATNLQDALRTFEELGAPLWAQRVRTELDRTTGGRSCAAELTSAEHRVAELASTGLTNRQVAAALFISPKTVEGNLSSIYRKLGIRSRAELGRRMGASEGS